MRLHRLAIPFALAMSLATASCRVAAPHGAIAVLEVRGFGEIRFALLDQIAPRHVANFIALARARFYDGTTFHRVIPKFMIQGGDPNSKDANPDNDGYGGPGYRLEPEFSDVHHDPGIVSMARGADPASAGSQFFIMATGSEQWRSELDGQYSVFGRVVSGQDVVDAISNTPRGSRDRPLHDVVIESVAIVTGAK